MIQLQKEITTMGRQHPDAIDRDVLEEMKEGIQEKIEDTKFENTALTFKEKNGGRNSNFELDLHELAVDESILILEHHISQITIKLNQKQFTPSHPHKHEFKIITGRGVHSKGGAKIRPMVQKWLRKYNYEFRMCSKGGAIIVVLNTK